MNYLKTQTSSKLAFSDAKRRLSYLLFADACHEYEPENYHKQVASRSWIVSFSSHFHWDSRINIVKLRHRSLVYSDL